MAKAKAEKASNAEQADAPKESKGCGKGLSKANLKKGRFHAYCLVALGIPREAWPDPERTHYGRHSYTVVSAAGSCVPSLKITVGCWSYPTLVARKHPAL